MVQAVSNEQIFVTNLEQFMSKADKFIKIYYSGISEENHLTKIVQELSKLASDTNLQQLEFDYQSHCEIKDLMTDFDENSWF